MKSRIAVAAVIAVIGCARQQPNVVQARPPLVVESPARDVYAIGTVLTPEGAVASSSVTDEIPRGGPLYLSVNVSGTSAPPVVEVVWHDPTGKILRQERKEARAQAPFVSFSSGDTAAWRAGRHLAEVFVNDRKVTERAVNLL